MNIQQDNFIISTFSLQDEDWFYKSEGNCNIVLALPERQEVIRIRKSYSYNTTLESKQINRFEHDFYYYKYVYPLLLHPKLIGLPKFIQIPLTEIDYLNENIDTHRPAERKNKKLYSGLASLYPDYTRMNEDLGFGPTVTIEIKPKQAHCVEQDRLHKCKYCLKQYEKLDSNSIKKISHYCPLDLFSGDLQRMNKAIVSLLENPQNNLKIFDNGLLTYGEEKLNNKELDSLISRLLGKSINFIESKNIFIKMILNSLLQDISGINKVNVLDLTNNIASNLNKDNILEKNCNWNKQIMEENCVLNLLLKMQKLNDTSVDEFANIEENEDLPPLPDYFPNPKEIQLREFKKLPKDLRYLLFSTASDCSIMLSFKRIDYQQDQMKNDQDYQIIQIKDSFFISRVKVIDLDIKTKSGILKHYKTKALWKEMYSNMN